MFQNIATCTLLFFVLIAVSCKETNTENVPEINESTQEPAKTKRENAVSMSASDLKSKLQGEWRRIDYPFSRYEFKGDKSLLLQEGQAEKPEFMAFEILKKCPFKGKLNEVLVNDEFIISYAKYASCEKVSVRNDTLRTGDLMGKYTIKYVRK
ncbi:hypothetical protein [Nonlabens antarcticus]|uniref:hypothetical protein n=1 Tax=Nonlabens antarcticus TaxID=392714 RepID=UPI00189138DC|nr:hypothetical protein [Nonlabens antarcticus]